MNATANDVLPKPFMFRLEFPPEVAAERTEVFALILRLMAENTSASVQEACRLQLAWLERYPDDYAMLDLGESLWMLADAIEATTVSETDTVVALAY